MVVCSKNQCRILSALIAAALYAVPLQLSAQPAAGKSTIRIVLLNGETSGLSARESNSFFSNLQGKLSQFPTLSVSFKADLARGLNIMDRAALEKCSDINCVRQFASKAGFQRMILYRITKKNTLYRFQSYEFDVRTSRQLSQISDAAVCASADEVDNFVKKVAIKVGQSTTNDSSIPESLQESSSNVWWYVGAAVTVGVAGGVVYFISHKKESPTSPSSLPLPPNFP